VMNVMSQMIAR